MYTIEKQEYKLDNTLGSGTKIDLKESQKQILSNTKGKLKVKFVFQLPQH